MNGQSIPGFYFDVEKQKYFKIQPGHKLPEDSKYALSSVKKENRARKRTKQEAQQHQERLAARPSLTAALRFGTLTGSALSRETGRRSAQQTTLDSSCTYAANLSLTITKVSQKDTRLRAAYPVLASRQLVLVLEPWITTRVAWDHTTMDHVYKALPRSSWTTRYWHQLSQADATHTAQLHRLQLQLIAPQFISWFYEVEPAALEELQLPLDATSIDIGQLELPNSIIDAKIRNQHRIGIAFIDQLANLDTHRQQLQVLNIKREVSCVDWLSNDVLIAGQGKGVRLWDVRTQDSLTRIHHRKRVTNTAAVPDSNGTQILVSDNHGLKLYDLRMTSKDRDRHPLEFHGVHEGPRALVDLGPAGLVAAYIDNTMQVLSLRQGRRVATYELPGPPTARPTQLIWAEDASGSPYIQMCVNNDILRWTMHAGDGE